MTRLRIDSAGPGLTLQDLGRPGHMAAGLSIGGAADRRAIREAARLLAQPPGLAIEMAGFGGRFVTTGSLTIALTGAPMRVMLDGQPLAWHASHELAPGAILDIGSVQVGTYGYLSVGGTIEEPAFLGSGSAHLGAGIGRRLQPGDELCVSTRETPSGMRLSIPDRFSGGTIRVIEGPQTEMFPEATIKAFCAATFLRTTRGNRMGAEFDAGRAFAAEGGLSVVSEMIVPGDIQMTGAGAPFILGPECQTTGGYPRIATVIPPDLAKALQAAPGATINFRFVDRDEALSALRADNAEVEAMKPEPMTRDPHDIADLLSYQLISGVTNGEDQ